MKLEKLVLAASFGLALVGCETEEVIRKPYRKAKPIPAVKIDTTPIVKREGYETLRLDQGEFEIYDVTVYKPKPNLDLKAQSSLINDLSSNYNFYLKDAKKELNLETLTSEGMLPISKPVYDAIDSLEKSLNLQGSDKSTKALALCSVIGSSNNKIQKRFGYGIRIGANYIIVPASVIYPAIISKELGEDPTIEFSMLSEQKTAGHGTVHKGQVLAINPLADIALLETEEKFYTGIFMPILEEKQIEEAKIFIDRTPLNLTGVFKLTEDQVIWRLAGKEIDLAKSLNYSIATIEKLTNKKGLGVYNDSGLVGLIAQDIKKYLDSEEEFQNALVIPGSQIRKFLTDYLNFLKSGSNNLEIITKELQKEIKTTEQITPNIPTTSFNPTTTQPSITLESKTSPIKQEVPSLPQKPISVPWGKWILGYLGTILSAGIIGRYIYLESEKKIIEERPNPNNIRERTDEIKRWYKEIKSNEVLSTEVDINNQKTIINPDDRDKNVRVRELSSLKKQKNDLQKGLSFHVSAFSGLIEIPEEIKQSLNYIDLRIKRLEEQNKKINKDVAEKERSQTETLDHIEEQSSEEFDKKVEEKNFIVMYQRNEIDPVYWLSEETKNRIIRLIDGLKYKDFKLPPRKQLSGLDPFLKLKI